MARVITAKLAVSAATFHIDRPYSYKIPESLLEATVPGVRVTAPFGRGNRRTEGIVLSVSEAEDESRLKTIDTVLDDAPVLTAEQLRLCVWMAEQFFCTVYSAARAMLPAGMWFKDGVRRTSDKLLQIARLAIPAEEASALSERKRLTAPMQAAVLGLLSQTEAMSVPELCYLTGASRPSVKALEKQEAIEIIQQEVLRRPAIHVRDEAEPIELNPGQAAAFEGIASLISAGEAAAALLYGVTGSGKTAVYIRLIEHARALGKTAMVLVPEIALTPQLLSLFAAHFGDSVAVLHSALAIGERYDEWKRIKRGDVSVVVGTRSAVFAPLSNLGLIVIDEEQEHTYKSESAPRYHAREAAKYRCAHEQAVLLLGSATPSVESMYNAREGRYALFCLETRYNEMALPSVLIADMKKELKNGNGGAISALLQQELAENIQRGEQSILFLNRRGASKLVVCPECGYTFMCVSCSVAMTHHTANNRLMCHYCGYSEALAEACPECAGRLKFVGPGTQSVEQELSEIFPGVDIIRMDADTVSHVNSHEVLLRRFREEKAPILLGTQMVAKGLDFENVTLVGVLSADLSLYAGDYRAHERTFSLITQVIGRSGRGEKAGRAVIQTFSPANEVILLASAQDYDAFYEGEIALRRAVEAPPVTDLLTVTVTGAEEAAVLAGCVKLRNTLAGYTAGLKDLRILGPAPAVISRLNNRYRYKISLLGKNNKALRTIIAHSIKEFLRDPKLRGLSAYADVNPLE